MASVPRKALGTSLGLMLAGTLGAIALRQLDKEPTEEQKNRIEQLLLLINRTIAAKPQSDEAAILRCALMGIKHPGIQGEAGEWEHRFTAWEAWGLRLQALAHGKPSEATIRGLKHLIAELERALGAASIPLPPLNS
jgi:hypothetical protein